MKNILFVAAVSVMLFIGCSSPKERKVTVSDVDISETIKDFVEDSKKTTTSSGSSDIDEMLVSYEKYVDQYIKYVKKVSDGDLSAMVEYSNFLEKTTDLAEKMEKVQSNFSSAQLKKYLEINNKFTNALIDIAE